MKLVNHGLMVFSEGNFWPRCLLTEVSKKEMFRGLVICSENVGRERRKWAKWMVRTVQCLELYPFSGTWSLLMYWMLMQKLKLPQVWWLSKATGVYGGSRREPRLECLGLEQVPFPHTMLASSPSDNHRPLWREITEIVMVWDILLN